MLSIVVPCYNEELCIDAFVDAVIAVSPNVGDYEIVFVDDGSTDATLRRVKELSENADNIHYISFSRNFGKEAAMLAGLRKAKGTVIVTMDADLQDPPSCLPQMLDGIDEGYDSVATRRTTRAGEPPIRSLFARCFYRLMRHFSDVEIMDGARDYRMMSRKVVDAILSLPENNRFTKGIYQWVGFKTKWIEFENVGRSAGETKWSFWKLFVYSLDGMLAFTIMPLQIAAWMGVLCCFASFSYMLWVWVRVMLWGDPVAGWPSMVCLILFLGGIQLLGCGILGVYLGKVYLEVKRRPAYIVSEEG